MNSAWQLVHDDDGIRDLLFVDTDHLKAIADVCVGRHNSGVTGSKDMPHLAEFPAEIVEKYLVDAGITLHEWMNNPVHVKRMLQDPALAHFRIDRRNVGRAVE